jgi:hypothetical protein
VAAINKAGEGQASDTITARTEGTGNVSYLT